MRIDMHAHYFPAAYLDMLDEARGSSDGTAPVRGLGGDEPEDIEERLRLMDAAGVDVQLLSAGPQMPDVANATAAIAAARTANAAYAELVRDHPDRFRAVATLPLPHVLAAVDELNRTMDDLGFAGAAVGTTVAGRALGDPEFEPVLQALDRRGALLLVHPLGDGAGIGRVVEQSAELTTAMMHLFRARVTERYPGIRIVFAHMCGMAPFVARRFELHQGRFMEPAPPSVGELMRTVYYDTANPDPAALRLLAGRVGADRLVLGTDYPFERDGSFAEHASFVVRSGLPEADVKAVESATAALLLGMEA